MDLLITSTTLNGSLTIPSPQICAQWIYENHQSTALSDSYWKSSQSFLTLPCIKMYTTFLANFVTSSVHIHLIHVILPTIRVNQICLACLFSLLLFIQNSVVNWQIDQPNYSFQGEETLSWTQSRNTLHLTEPINGLPHSKQLATGPLLSQINPVPTVPYHPFKINSDTCKQQDEQYVYKKQICAMVWGVDCQPLTAAVNVENVVDKVALGVSMSTSVFLSVSLH